MRLDPASIVIREADPEDVPGLKALHDRAIRELGRSHYTLQQLEEWIDRSPLEKYYWRLERQRLFIAERDGRLLGYARWDPTTKEFCSIGVDPVFSRQGIGSRLMDHVCQDARDHDLDRLWLDASLNAVPFYESHGWAAVARMTDGPLDYVRMEKELSAGHIPAD